MSECEGFCKGPINTRFGLMADPKIMLDDSSFHTIFLKHSASGYNCPIGYKHNPTTKEKTKALVQAGGRFSICPRNPWKWDLK